MTMKKLLPVWFLPVLLLLLSHMSQAQDKDKWDLRRCVEYAIANNISVKQSDVQARLAALTLQQSKLQQIPNLSFNGNTGYSAGRNQDPNTYALTTQGYVFNQFSLQSSVNIFNFNNLRYNVEGNRFAYDAANATTDKLRNDIALNVANAYLTYLLDVGTSVAADTKLKFSQAQLELTRKQVAAGALPELNAAELEAQVAQDSSAYLTALSNIQTAILNVKAYMSLDASTPFMLDTPPVEKIPVETLAELQPEVVYSMALHNQPQQKADEYYIKAAQKFVSANKAAMLPTVSLFGSLGTTYTDQTQHVESTSLIVNPPVGKVTVGGTDYTVFSPGTFPSPNYAKQPYFSQLDQAFRQQVGMQINIPILNGGSLKIGYAKSKENLRNYELQQQSDNLTLKQNIYQAYNLASAAREKFEANKKTLAATQRSFEYSQKRYKIGMLNTIDLITNQNNYFNAQNDLLYSQFDYVFKMKVLEFYKGLGIKL